MQPLKPYLLRAYYQWICESDCTPCILVQADLPHVQVPESYIDEDQQVVLNISPAATHDMQMTQFRFQFQARFDAQVFDIIVPYYAIISLYAEENEEGIYFEVSQEEVRLAEEAFLQELGASRKPVVTTRAATKPQRSHLRVVRDDE